LLLFKVWKYRLWITQINNLSFLRPFYLEGDDMAKRLRARPSNAVILMVGSLLILILLAVSGLNRPLPSYLIAASNLAPGSKLTLESLRVEQLDLGTVAENYLTTVDLERGELVIPVSEGELIPKRALGRGLGRNQTSIRLTPELRPASQIIAGSTVSIWQVVEVDQGYESQLLVPTALVSELEYGDGLFAGELPEVELLISNDQALVVMQAVTSKSEIFILPRP
jgi:hypothetical protein